MKNPELELRYMHALGYMVYWFSHAEYAAFYFLFNRAGLSASEAAAILNGTRISSSIQMARRLFRAHATPLPPAVDSCLAQLTVLNDFRNLLLHYGPYEHEGSTVTSSWPVMLPDMNIKPAPADTETLRNITSDLRTIVQVLFDYAEADPPDSEHPLIQDNRDKARSRAWRYTPPRPSKRERAVRLSGAKRPSRTPPESPSEQS